MQFSMFTDTRPNARLGAKIEKKRLKRSGTLLASWQDEPGENVWCCALRIVG